MKCEICKDKISETKLVDKTEICYTCYQHIFKELFRADFTKEDCISTLKFNTEYFKEVEKYLQQVRKDKYLKENIKIIEGKYSLELWNKDRCCLKKNEHLKVIQLLQAREEFHKELPLINNDAYNYKEDYFIECEYLK